MAAPPESPQDLGPRTTFVADSDESRLPGFAWKLPPYEYVWDRRPIDILFGNAWLAPMVQADAPLDEIAARMAAQAEAFAPRTLRY